MNEQTEALEKQILEDARRQARPIKRRARRRAEEQVEEAREEAEQKRQEVLQKAREDAEAEAGRIKARTELEVANIRRRAREELLEGVRERAVERIKELTESEDYPQMLIRLALRSVEAMDGRRFELLIRPEDRDAHGEEVAEKLRRAAGEKLGREVTVSVAEETIGADAGLLVRREDGTQFCDQSCAARLERLWPELRQELARILELGEVEDEEQ